MRHPRCLSLAAAALLFGSWALLGCEQPLEPGDPERGHRLVLQKCTFCHYVDGRGGFIAPPLEKGIALAEEVARDYEKRAADLERLHPKSHAAAREKISAVLAEKDSTRRLELWFDTYLRDTKFDNPMTKMGNVLLQDQERVDIVAWLMTKRVLR